MRDPSPAPPPDPAQEPEALTAAAVRLLTRNDRASRLAAAQLLARGYAISEERRLADQPEGLRQTELDRLLAPDLP